MPPTWRAVKMFLSCPGRLEARGSMVGGRPVGLGEGLVWLAGLLADRHATGERVRSVCSLARTILGADGCTLFLSPEGGPFTVLGADGLPGSLSVDGHQAPPPPPWAFSFPLSPAEATLVVTYATAPADEAAVRVRGEALAKLLAQTLLESGDAALALKQRADEAQMLREFGRAIDACPDPVDALPAALAKVGEVTGLWLGTFECGDRGGAVELVGQSSDAPSAAALTAALAKDEADGAAYVASPWAEATGGLSSLDFGSALGKVLAAAGTTSGLVVPLRAGMHGVGVLCVAGQANLLAGWQGALALLAERLAWALERARLFRLVERAKREWEATLDTIAEGVAILDSDLTILRANWAFARLMGTTPRDIVGQKGESLAYGIVTGRRDAASDWAGRELENVSHDVQVDDRYLSVTVYPFLNDRHGRVGFVHVLRDVTEERRWQETVVRTERLRALGEMATGVAHSFGNLLVSIGGWAEVLLSDSEDEAVRRPANAIQQAALDGAEAVRRLQNYARSQHGAPYVPVDPNSIARDALELSQPRWRPLSVRRKVTFAVSVDLQPVPPVSGNAAELREVLLNLIFNAIDAMPAGGRLAVSTCEREAEVLITVHDSGTGIPAEVRKRIFDPFFTTKGQGGSGLGLAIAAGVVERHGGRIEVESRPGEGSAFTVILPVCAQVEE